MAQFMATIAGNRGPASRLGSKKSGLDVTANGWGCGIRVRAHHVDNKDVFDISVTGGSNGGRSDKLLATLDDEGKLEVFIKGKNFTEETI